METTLTYRNPVKNPTERRDALELNDEQRAVADGILADYDAGTRGTYLIHGVTGSGKTEVYMELIAHAVSMGKAAIMLIPEIALTYQTVMRFYNRFGDRVSFLHSRLSAGERYDQFLRAKNREIDIIIGPRSALFTPFEDIGFIIIDEEHETTYRSENIPQYDARDTAIALARLSGASVVLGSATPSVESYYRAKKGIYKLYEMPHRVKARSLPRVQVVDLRTELAEGNRSVLSRALQEAIESRLKKKEQVILFINRRGLNGAVSCRACGSVLKCPHCDVSLSEHRGGKLVCHYCGYEMPVVKQCPVCGSFAIKSFKAGTQMMEEVVKRRFPDAEVLRMDADTTKNKDGHEKILSAFANQQADILVGTQMIVKGHDFPNVTLVGVLAADLSLHAPDYHASERTFQLLTQAAGRAGRGQVPGEVIIQTYLPDHFSIQSAQAQDYGGFYEHEIAYRKLLHYPPVWYMEEILLSGPRAKEVAEGAMEIRKQLQSYAKEQIAIIGPTDPPIAKLNDMYRKVVFIKSEHRPLLVQMKDGVEKFVKENAAFRRVNVQFKFD